MHIEPGIVEGAKIALSHATAAGAIGLAAHMAATSLRRDGGIAALAGRAGVAGALAFGFFQILPHFPVGVSEVHFILGATLYLLFGGGAAALGLGAGLLAQGLFFAPADLPQFGMNLTTLLVPLWAAHLLARRLIAADTPYVALSYGQVLSLSLCYQGGVVAWVAFWAFYGQGFGAGNVSAVGSFGAAYLLVVVVEPLLDLGVLALARRLPRAASLFAPRLTGTA